MLLWWCFKHRMTGMLVKDVGNTSCLKSNRLLTDGCPDLSLALVEVTSC